MKKLIVFALVIFAGICSGSLASAQEHQLRGQIPFDFTAGSARLSAGEYHITYDISGIVTFRNMEKGKTVTMLVGADRGVNDGTCKLIFAHATVISTSSSNPAAAQPTELLCSRFRT